MTCSRCGTALGEDSRFCRSCGAAIASPDDATVASPAQQSLRASDPARSDSLRHGRFLPGTLIGDRFRIVAMLGRGGMGEVFRADDMKLGQAVALKFLPQSFASDPARLERLHGEVRIARQVAHPNVCRVYDVGEIAGETFLTMEYIEGENLAALLKRIGRLPEAKGLDIARQLCAGLAAAHERGVLHRDLKPANIMLDDRGMVCITDFGLAALASDADQSNPMEGTPAYMAPEQFTGREFSARSDIYSLGLILYELFTGVAAFRAATVAALVEQRASAPDPPSAVCGDINPVIERVILDCLDADPRKRPASAMEVAGRLPGRDLISAALSAGQTPSPDLLAAAGGEGAFPFSMALACVVAIVLAVVLFASTYDSTHVIGIASLPQSPQVLVSKAREVAARFGYSRQPYSAYGFSVDEELIKSLSKDKSALRWEKLASRQPAAVSFWYRESPLPLVVTRFLTTRPSAGDPPPGRTGMILVSLDPEGNLERFAAVPPQIQPAAAPKVPDFSAAFALMALDGRKFLPVAPTWTPLAWGDTRAAWLGKSPERNVDLRIEAAASGGRIISLSEIAPWVKPWRDQVGMMPELGRAERVMMAIGVSAVLIIFGAAAFLARRNFRLGRGDRRGAFRVAVAMFAILLAAGLLNAVHASSMAELVQMVVIAATAIFIAAIVWLLYIALEPFLRRRWPHVLISWNRLLTGRFRDPLVARDVLIGITAGAVMSIPLYTIALELLHRPPTTPAVCNLDALLGPRQALAATVWVAAMTVAACFANYLELMILRVIFRRTWIAGAIFLTVNFSAALSEPDAAIVLIPHIALVSLIVLYLYLRVGLVGALVATFVTLMAGTLPLTADASSFYFPATVLAAGIVAFLTFWSFRRVLGGRPLFNEAVLES